MRHITWGPAATHGTAAVLTAAARARGRTLRRRRVQPHGGPHRSCLVTCCQNAPRTLARRESRVRCRLRAVGATLSRSRHGPRDGLRLVPGGPASQRTLQLPPVPSLHHGGACAESPAGGCSHPAAWGHRPGGRVYEGASYTLSALHTRGALLCFATAVARTRTLCMPGWRWSTAWRVAWGRLGLLGSRQSRVRDARPLFTQLADSRARLYPGAGVPGRGAGDGHQAERVRQLVRLP